MSVKETLPLTPTKDETSWYRLVVVRDQGQIFLVKKQLNRIWTISLKSSDRCFQAISCDHFRIGRYGRKVARLQEVNNSDLSIQAICEWKTMVDNNQPELVSGSKPRCCAVISECGAIFPIRELNGLFAEYVPTLNQEARRSTTETGTDKTVLFEKPEVGNIHSGLSAQSRQQLKNTSSQVTTWNNSKPEVQEKMCFRCPVCDKSFRHLSALMSHQEVHSHTPDLFCRFCTRTFMGPRKLWYHCKKSHADEIDSRSRTSGEQVRKAEELGNPCSECDKCFATWRSLQKHRKCVHEKKQRYLCEQCVQTFTTKTNAIRHRDNAHGKEGRSICEFCGKTFSRFDVLQRHIKSIHNQQHKPLH
ncbi:PR domain zinc finger protein 5 [Clonorchis sinensis]|uniref:PR domain zinc finger protein 5 n=1 Tax=Clonorchis sinensis TaxID=79923 RepID=H2KTA1_CLOSI|nr:PR domain zinc finger protein 5 [Clonorchis sinensis]